jgi:hypothetical protein
MKSLICCTLAIAATAVLAPGARAEEPSSREVLEACAQNRAERLPNPYTDVSPGHWAYRAVLSMHYCGAYRGAVPPEQYEKTLRQKTNPAPPS